jgi:hypothetical protein
VGARSMSQGLRVLVLGVRSGVVRRAPSQSILRDEMVDGHGPGAAAFANSLSSRGIERRTAWLAWSNSNYGIRQDRNPFELPREFLPALAKSVFRDGFQCELRARDYSAAAGLSADRVHRPGRTCIRF